MYFASSSFQAYECIFSFFTAHPDSYLASRQAAQYALSAAEARVAQLKEEQLRERVRIGKLQSEVEALGKLQHERDALAQLLGQVRRKRIDLYVIWTDRLFLNGDLNANVKDGVVLFTAFKEATGFEQVTLVVYTKPA